MYPPHVAIANPDESLHVERWPTERPLLILNGLVAAGLWFLFLRSTRSVGYLGGWIAILALMNVAFVAAIRGSAVRLGPEQFPDLHARVLELARRFGLPRPPDVYLMQQNGALNAFAMRFARTHMVVLLSDLLEACGDNVAARDMIIGHELGHIRAGHLRARWLLLPTGFVPFLGSALSRAREYTCDRYGAAAAGDREGALLGLAILSAGGKYGPLVNRAALAGQRHDLREGWMVVGEWLGSHPPLAKRIAVLTPEAALHGARPSPLRVARVAFAGAMVVAVGLAAAASYLPGFTASQVSAAGARVNDRASDEKVGRDLQRPKDFLESERRQGHAMPWDTWDLYDRWQSAHAGDAAPTDPYSGYWYDYASQGDAYRVWSLGPDGDNHTADDLVLESEPGATPHRRYTPRH